MTQLVEASFYVTGGTLERSARSYVPRAADRELFAALDAGRFCYVLTPRQMGKSSLMVRTAARLRERGHTAVVLDLTEVGQNLSVEQWYRGLLGTVAESLGLEDELVAFWRSHPDLGPQQRWMKALREVVVPRCTGRVVVFVDEIDVVRSLPFSTDEFFAGIREAYNRRGESPSSARLTFCLLGVASPTDLVRDTRTTPFNVGQRVELRDFAADEVEPLLDGLGRDRDRARQLLTRVLHWTGGHPYLTQRLCKAVANEAAVASDVDRVAHSLFLDPRARDRDDNLLFVRDRILRAEADVSALLFLYGRIRNGERVVDDESNPLITVLKLSGIIRVQSGELRVRNRIYEQVFDGNWVVENLPGAEVRRQRRAYREGLVRAGAASALALAVVAIVAGYAWRQWTRAEDLVGVAETQREIAEREGATSRRLRYVAHMALAFRELDSGNYARIAEIVDEEWPDPEKGDRRGWEYSYLWRLVHAETAILAHPGPVAAGACSPDGALLATSGEDGSVRLWNTRTRALATTLEGAGEATALGFSPDGTVLAAGLADGTVALWDVRSAARIGDLAGNAGAVSGVAFSPDGASLATSSRDGDVRLWDVATRRPRVVLGSHRDGALSVAYSPDGAALASCGADGSLRLWDAATGEERGVASQLRAGALTSVRFAPDGRRLAVGSAQGLVLLVDVASGHEVARMKGGSTGVSALAFGLDGTRIVVGSGEGTALVLDTATGEVEARLAGHRGAVSAIGFVADRRLVATTSVDGTARFWDPDRARDTVTTLAGHTDTVYSVAFSPDGTRLATASFDRTVGIWDARSGNRVGTLAGHDDCVMAVAFSPDGTKLATGSLDRTARVWDVATGRLLATLASHSERVFSVAFFPDGRRLASASFDGTVRVWSVDSGTELAALRGPGGAIEALAVSPDGRSLIAVGADRSILVWDATTLAEVRRIELASDWLNAVAVSRDGRRIAAAGSYGDATVRVLDGSTFEAVYVLKGFVRSGAADLLGGHGRANSLAFDAGGTTLVAGVEDARVKFFDMETGQELGSAATNQKGRICSVAFSPDGTVLATAADDGTVRLWRAATAEELSAYRTSVR